MSKNVSKAVEKKAKKSYAEKQRDLYDTTSLHEIMNRFYGAVSPGR